ncbi:MAG: HAD hydrolase-like protein [Pseudomonadota bacterium]
MHNIPLPTIVLFDMDGTTVRHVQPWLLNILECIDDLFYKGARLIARLRRGREMIDFSDEPATKRGLLVHRALHKVRRKDVSQIVQPCPGILPLLRFFKEQNVPMALVSNGLGKGYGHEIVETFKLDRFFDAYIFREDAEKAKPHPDSLLRGLKALKENPSQNDVVWFIGDRHKDIQAALSAKQFIECDFIPFGYGINAAIETLKNGLGTDHVILNYTDFVLNVAELYEDSNKNNTQRSEETKASRSAS